MDNLNLIEFIKNLDYEGVEEALSPKWNCCAYNQENFDYLKNNTNLMVFESEADMVDNLSESFADDYAQNDPFLKEHELSDDIICCETQRGEKVLEYPYILPHPKIDIHGFAIPYYTRLYSVYFDGLDYMESAFVKQFIWNLCIEKTIFKLQSKVRYKLSINTNPATNIKAIMVEDCFGSINSIKDLNLYIQRYYNGTPVLSNGFIKRKIIIDSSINNLSDDVIPKNIEITVILKDKRKQIKSKLIHCLSVNTNKSISLLPDHFSLIGILEKQIEMLRGEINEGKEGNKDFIIAPKELYEIFMFFSLNDIKSSYGHITEVFNVEKTYKIAQINAYIYEEEKEKYLDDFYSDEGSCFFDPYLDLEFSNWFDWSYIVDRKNKYILAYLEK